MNTKHVVLAALIAVGFALYAGDRAEARLTAEPLPPTTAPPAVAPAPAADCCAPVSCCPKPCVTYRHRGPKLCCGNCDPPVPTVLLVKNPCTGCETEVSVCIPACCTGEPKVCCGSGFLGRNVVEYAWCCGYSVRVAFKHSGDLLVTTWGR